jgi:hypothetical protein
LVLFLNYLFKLPRILVSSTSLWLNLFHGHLRGQIFDKVGIRQFGYLNEFSAGDSGVFVWNIPEAMEQLRSSKGKSMVSFSDESWQYPDPLPFSLLQKINSFLERALQWENIGKSIVFLLTNTRYIKAPGYILPVETLIAIYGI